MKTKSSGRSTPAHGFSLLELLTTLLVIGVILGLLLAVLGPRTWSAAREATNKRNAQAVAMLSASAQAAGSNHVVAGDVDASVQPLVDGITVQVGRLGTMHFRTKLDAESLAGAKYYLEVQNGALLFDPDKPPP